MNEASPESQPSGPPLALLALSVCTAASLLAATYWGMVVAPIEEQMGIVQKIFPKEELLDQTLAFAEDLAINVPPASTAVIKQQVLHHPTM